jgi:argininosuccinate synthase
VLEDPWTEPPPEAYEWTRDPEDAPATPAYLEIEYESGMPVRLNGEDIGPVAMVERLNELGGLHGVGRIDHIEDRLVGIKSREIYEAPAGVILHTAHRALETMTLSKQQVKLKKLVAIEYSELIYNGLWFSAHHQDIAAYGREHPAPCDRHHPREAPAWPRHRRRGGRRRTHSMTGASRRMIEGDTYDQSAAVGFINIWGLQTRTRCGPNCWPTCPTHFGLRCRMNTRSRR